MLGRTRQRKECAIQLHNYPLALHCRQQEMRLIQELLAREGQWYCQRTRERTVVTERQIAEILALWTGIPLRQITANQAERLLHLEEDLHQRITGQDEAIRLLARAVRRAYANIRDPRRPIGSFLFVGPTGVGKSELARALASSLFPDESALLTLDMSEFMERHQVARLIGSPPGYVGCDNGGQLTEFIRRRPYSVVLFDEIEKAHPDVFDLLLQVFEDGQLTDARGQVADFRNAIIILTSNLGTEHSQTGPISFTALSQAEQAIEHTMHERAMDAVKNFFHPELLQRIDELIFFHPLETHHLQQIVDLLIARTSQRLAQQSIELQVTEPARELLIVQGYKPAYGARPLRRAVQRLLDDVLAESILHGSLSPQDLAIVDAETDHLVVHTQELAVAKGRR